jgi:hypothetical protein
MIVIGIALYVIIGLATALAMPKVPGCDARVEFWADVIAGCFWPVIVIAFILARLFNGGRK